MAGVRLGGLSRLPRRGHPYRRPALRRGPANLLWLEAASGGVAALAGLPLLLDAGARRRATQPHPTRFEGLRRAAVGALFGLHTVRFRIYLQPDQGLRDGVAAGSVDRADRIAPSNGRGLTDGPTA